MAKATSFYPRLREGGDGLRWQLRSHQRRFYPRLREGGDGCHNSRFLTQGCFYPRLREGGDSRCALTPVRSLGFLPTPPRGRRLQEEAFLLLT